MDTSSFFPCPACGEPMMGGLRIKLPCKHVLHFACHFSMLAAELDNCPKPGCQGMLTLNKAEMRAAHRWVESLEVMDDYTDDEEMEGDEEEEDDEDEEEEEEDEDDDEDEDEE